MCNYRKPTFGSAVYLWPRPCFFGQIPRPAPHLLQCSAQAPSDVTEPKVTQASLPVPRSTSHAHWAGAAECVATQEHKRSDSGTSLWNRQRRQFYLCSAPLNAAPGYPDKVGTPMLPLRRTGSPKQLPLSRISLKNAASACMIRAWPRKLFLSNLTPTST